MAISSSEREQIWKLYERYGYRTLEIDEDFLIFVLENVMYPAVDILIFDEHSAKHLSKKSEYSAIGYGVRVTVYHGLSSVEDYLFQGFFRVGIVAKQLEMNYSRYAEKQMKLYGRDKSEYRYIPIPYSIEVNFNDEPHTDGLVDSIFKNMQGSHPVLIIIEAAAGYGKTSTAYELIHQYNTRMPEVRPFFMELAKDRTASNFRYLLLSQMEQQFDIILKNDVVLHNIRQGRIPLIIDGFDELLSADLDNGGVNIDFKEVETMLSTIAELLTDHSKVVLTTRKTAIFSGESFIDWYYNRIDSAFNFDIIRYQLNAPALHDWLDARRRKAFGERHIGSSIANPVLMGYLRYINDQEYDEIIRDPYLLTDKFFSFMLKREIERQDLPFSVAEQYRILRRLAALFAGYNITSDSRASVKQALLELNRNLIEQKAVTKDAESIANTLTNHALLDRKGTENIGFLNDFIFGTLFMHSVINDDRDMIDYYRETSYPFLEKAILAAAVADINDRALFYDRLQTFCSLNTSLRFWAAVKLRGATFGAFKGESFDAGTLYNPVEESKFAEGIGNVISDCSFTNIIFHQCHFNFEQIVNCTFINCRFDECTKNGATLQCEFYNCTERCEEKFVDEALETIQAEEYNEEMLRRDILLSFVKVNGHTRRMRMISKLREDFSDHDNKFSFKKTFNSLCNEGCIYCNGDKAFLTADGLKLVNQLQ